MMIGYEGKERWSWPQALWGKRWNTLFHTTTGQVGVRVEYRCGDGDVSMTAGQLVKLLLLGVDRAAKESASKGALMLF